MPVQVVELGRELVPLDWIWLAPEVEAAGQAWEQGKEQGQVVVLAAAVVEACSGMPCVVLLEVAAAWVVAWAWPVQVVAEQGPGAGAGAWTWLSAGVGLAGVVVEPVAAAAGQELAEAVVSVTASSFWPPPWQQLPPSWISPLPPSWPALLALLE